MKKSVKVADASKAPLAGLGLLVILSLLALLPTPVSPGKTVAQDTLRVVFTPDIFTAVNRNDALASSRAWIEAVGHESGLSLWVEVDTYDSIEDLERIAQTWSADVFVMNSVHYLGLTTGQDLLDPMFLPQRGDFVLDAYVPLARTIDGYRLPDLLGIELLFLETAGTSLGRQWLNSILVDSDLGPLDRFCPSAQSVAKPSAAVLPVFFGQIDACIVDESGFRIMKELNPQLGEVPEIVKRSPPYLETVVCVHQNFTKNREVLLDGLTTLHEDPSGQQILMVFKTNRLVPYYEESLASVRELCSLNQRTAEVAAR